MTPPPPTEKPAVAPIALIDLQYVIECHLDLAIARRDIMAEKHTTSAGLDREIRCLELLSEMAYTVSLDKERYRDFVIDIRAKYGRWVPPAQRIRKPEPEATEE